MNDSLLYARVVVKTQRSCVAEYGKEICKSAWNSCSMRTTHLRQGGQMGQKLHASRCKSAQVTKLVLTCVSFGQGFKALLNETQINKTSATCANLHWLTLTCEDLQRLASNLRFVWPPYRKWSAQAFACENLRFVWAEIKKRRWLLLV